MVRVIGGIARGHKLLMVKSEGTRPTGDRVKESLFNILGQDLSGYRVLDLFAGVGSIGIEALSRGAARVVMVDANPDCVTVIEKNLVQTHFDQSNVRVIKGDYHKALMNLTETFDLIYLDPPYASPLGLSALNLVMHMDILATDGIVVLEHDKSFVDPDDRAYRTKKYGQTYLSFFRRN